MDTTPPGAGFAPQQPTYLASDLEQVRDPAGVAPAGADGPAPHPATSAATRYLCVGAHVDPEFADRVIRDVLEDQHRAVSPSNGIDLVPIIRHCLAARRRRLGRDSAILGLLVASLFVSPLPTMTLATGAWASWFLYRLLIGWSERGAAKSLLLALGGVAVGFVVLLPVFSVLLLRQAIAGSLGVGTTQQVLGFLVLPIGVWAIVLVEAAQVRDVLVKHLSRNAYHPDRAPAAAGPATRARLEHLAREQYGNATVYSAYVPFVGSGLVFDSWSLVIDLQRPARDRPDGDGQEPQPPPRPIRVADLQRRVVGQFDRLGDSRFDHGDRLTGLRLDRHVFVDGSSIRGNRLFLPDPTGTPRSRLTDQEVERLADEHTGPVRQYLDVRIGSWNEELVVTAHVHFATSGRTLYLEAVTCLLPPINEDYRVVDAMSSRMTPGAMADLVATATRTFVSVFCRVPLEVGGAILGPLRRWIDDDRALAAIRENLSFDHGARTSVRELGAARRYHNYFQELDAAKYRKLIDLHVLQVVLDNLEEAGVDASAFRQQRAQVLNNIFNNNYGVQTGAGSKVTVGPNASFGNTTVNQPARPSGA